MKLDYKQMFENLQKLTAEKIKQEEHYFELNRKVNELHSYGNKIGKYFMKLPMADQIKVLESILYYQTVCKSLVEKYSLDDDIDVTETE